jgi:hypothetical protein
MAIAMVFFMFAPEVTLTEWQVGDLFVKTSAPICEIGLAPEPSYWMQPSEFIMPKPDPDDGED